MTVNQQLSKFDVGSLQSEDVQRIVLGCLQRYHKAKLLEGFYTMQWKLAKQLGVFVHSVNYLLVTEEAMQVPLTDHQVGLCLLNMWLSLTELSAFLTGL